MKGDVLVKRDDRIERCASEHRDEVTTNWEHDENDIDYQVGHQWLGREMLWRGTYCEGPGQRLWR